MLWCEGVNLLSGEPTWVPYETVHCNNASWFDGGGCFMGGSNGLASGNHRMEALSHALCEVIERDASSLWHAGGRAARQESKLDLTTVDDSACRQLLDLFEEARVCVGAWEITNDIGVPAFAAEIIDAERSQLRPLGGFAGWGCHVDRGVALARALSEAAQSRLTLIAGSRDDAGFDRHERVKSRRLAGVHRARLNEPPRREFQDAPMLEFPTIDADVDHQLACLESIGIREAIAVDLTRPGLDVPVVKVVVPGLEGSDHHWHAYRPGARARRVLEKSA